AALESAGRAAPHEGDPADARPEAAPQSGQGDLVKIEQNNDAPSFEKISACVHCGLCLEACPTYRELRVEMDSPRGRIYLMKGILQGKVSPSEDVLRSEEHTSELQSPYDLVCRLLLEKKKKS